MKFSILFLICGIWISSTMVGISYSQETEDNIVENSTLTGAVAGYQSISKPLDFFDLQVLLQIIHRNSDGDLIGYIETTEKLRIRPAWLTTYLNTIPDKKVIIQDGKLYELIQFEDYEPPVDKSKYSMAMFLLVTRFEDVGVQSIVTMNHEAYLIDPGDQITVYWTFLRQIS
jgi:hypothetical protein